MEEVFVTVPGGMISWLMVGAVFNLMDGVMIYPTGALFNDFMPRLE